MMKRSIKTMVSALAITLGVLTTSHAAFADIITYDLSNVVFNDGLTNAVGRTATGSFSVDTTTFAISNVNISTTADAFVPADTFANGYYIDIFHPVTPIYIPITWRAGDGGFVFPGSLPGANYGSFLYLFFDDSYLPLTGTAIPLDLRYQGGDWPANPDDTYNPNGKVNGGDYFVSGQLVASSVPEPSTLTLFGFALLGGAAMIYRKKLKSIKLRD